MRPQPWEFWIDVGGTFTDCFARLPDGTLKRHKLLSSGVTKGAVHEGSGPALVVDPARCADPAGFWNGFKLRLLSSAGQTVAEGRVVAFDAAGGRLALERPLAITGCPGQGYELWSDLDAPIIAIRYLLGLPADADIPPVRVRLGTTRGTNALITRRGARTALVTTRGFGDILHIGYQDRPKLFELVVRKPKPLFAAVVEIDERVTADGQVLQSPDEASVRDQLCEVKAQGIGSLAVCLLHGFKFPAHEELVARIARQVGFEEVSVSSRVAPLIKIVSRGDTTVVDGYLNPVLRGYVERLRQALGGGPECRGASNLPLPPGEGRGEGGLNDTAAAGNGDPIANAMFPHPSPLPEGEGKERPHPSPLPEGEGKECPHPSPLPEGEGKESPHPSSYSQTEGTTSPPASELRIMTSAGGLVSADRFVGKDSILSGPAGGVVGFARAARQAGFTRAIGFDMGGTSTDVARFDGRFELEYETEKAGVRVVAPMLAIETVAAGGGSICTFDGVKLVVGPDSAGADPGPACYGRGGPLAVTDLNFYLGKIPLRHFPFPLDRAAVEARLQTLIDAIAAATGRRYSTIELCDGFLKVANANMVKAIQSISVAKGYDPCDYVLVAFGGAAGQHACAVARELGMRQVLLHPDAGLLSAYGIGQADVIRHAAAGIYQPYSAQTVAALDERFQQMTDETRRAVLDEGVEPPQIEVRRALDLRYQGLDAYLTIPEPHDGDYAAAYAAEHERLYGYRRAGRPLEIVAARVEVVGHARQPLSPSHSMSGGLATHEAHAASWFDAVEYQTAVYDRGALLPGDVIDGPAIIHESASTTVVDPDWHGEILSGGELLLESEAGDSARDWGLGIGGSLARTPTTNPEPPAPSPVMLEIFNNQFAGIAEQMGITLRNTASSVNVKERLDFSCAIFTATGDLVVNAPHIPVHLGAMSETVKCLLEDFPQMAPGDVFVTNNPYRGGSHLPDVTVVTPVFSPDNADPLPDLNEDDRAAEISGNVAQPPSAVKRSPEATGRQPRAAVPQDRIHASVQHVENGEAAADQAGGPKLAFFTASRAHHAEIGGIRPGSLPPFSRNLAEEGVLIRGMKLVDRGQSNVAAFERLLLSGKYPTRNVADNLADVEAQAAANHRGARDLARLVERYGLDVVLTYMRHIQDAAERKMRAALARLGEGQYRFTDHLDDGAPIAVAVTIHGDSATIDFKGTGAVLPGNLNANRAIVTAAVMYCLRAFIGEDIPLNQGVLAPVKLILPEGLLNPPEGPSPETSAAVVGGNVETSQRVVDVLLGALNLAAASQGTMNNLVFGDGTFGYYETICGGAGATADADGADAVHTHMTNTRLTDPEVIEQRYPVRVRGFRIRRGSGGAGLHRGGDGVVRQLVFLRPLEVSIVSGRRGDYAPYGLAGGGPGAIGRNTLERADGTQENLGGRAQFTAAAGDVLTIETPGGGGWGNAAALKRS